MKTKFLLLLIAVCVFGSSCKKDKEETSASAQIVGKWITVSESYDYYDAQGRKIYSEPPSELDGPGIKVEFKSDGSFNIISGNNIENGKYSVFTADGKTYLKFLDSSDLQQVEIKSMSKQQMVWTEQFSNETYRENGLQKKSSTSAYTVTLNRQ